ncbi:hypothetical protein NECAME_00180 [Necator americanus]|uniref:Tartrate-resistant acid phosphatase type 5 n=1 Tax=Necator americanus TaxID=51031 RepID=W2TIB1_NECAM|nr:hypothetical protein NECAME_00180 [Necator americanus]ETN81830.1 hypothetical protein NECAME_00180 [Necator americanus]
MQGKLVALLGLAIFGIAVIGTLTSDVILIDDHFMSESVVKTSPTDSLRILLVGDTGGLPVYPFYSYAQKKVAKAMDNLAALKKVQYVINVGDNIYYTGVSDEHDSRFRTSFEDIYNTDALDVPWYLIAGNHDHFGNVSAQVAYSKYSKKWNFPKLYYNLTFQLNGTSMDVVMLDTIVLCGNTADIENGGFFDMLWNRSHDPQGPSDTKKAEEQWQWIEQMLSSSRADYLFVAGHYPIHSIASHGPTQCLVDRLDPLLRTYNVSAYFAGHDHTLQHIVYPNDYGHLTHYVVSGAASRSDRSKKHMDTVAKENLKFHYPTSWNPFSQLGFSNGAFIYMEITKDNTVMSFLNGKGQEKYRMSLDPRSKSTH